MRCSIKFLIRDMESLINFYWNIFTWTIFHVLSDWRSNKKMMIKIVKVFFISYLLNQLVQNECESNRFGWREKLNLENGWNKKSWNSVNKLFFQNGLIFTIDSELFKLKIHFNCYFIFKPFRVSFQSSLKKAYWTFLGKQQICKHDEQVIHDKHYQHLGKDAQLFG